MYVPLQHQISEYDCVPTAIINAVACLFERHEVPPMVVRHIYSYSLDTVSPGAKLGRAGTSKLAIRVLGQWLGAYRSGRFAVDTEYLDGASVGLSPAGRIRACVEDGGVALLNIRLSKGEEHFVTALASADGWMQCFDPYYRTSLRGLRDRVRHLDSDGRSPNLEIRLDWLDGEESDRRFCLGPRPEREALLMWRDR